MLNTKPSFAEILVSMPDVGEDADFARAGDSTDKMLAARQMQMFMKGAPSVEQVDLKALIEDGRAGGEILDALAEVDRSNQRIESMERKANGKATQETRE